MDWRGFCKRLLLADGRVDAAEAAMVRRAVLADRVVDQEEAEFLLELRRDAKFVHPDFNEFLYKVLRAAVLKDGALDAAEAAWLRRLIFADGLLAGKAELAFLQDLERAARRVAPEFRALVADCGGPRPA